MKYKIELKSKAFHDLKNINKIDQKRIIEKIDMLSNSLHGDVKKLTNFSPEYRLRVGNWRILFEIENELIIIYRILPRKESYR